MSVVRDRAATPEPHVGDDEAARTPRGGRARWGWPLLTTGLVVVLALIPLVNNRIFYYWDDSAAQFMPTWYHLGELIRSGEWPPYLDVDAWMGGNYAAEALFGLYNPLYVANYVLVSVLPDLAVAATLVKIEFLVVLALGVYLTCREHGAARWASSVFAVALPFSGFTLYFDTSVWAAGLMSFALVPHVWWSARKMARGRLNPIWVFLIGALTITTGNPYGTLGVCIVLFALLVEVGLRREWPALRQLVLVGLCIGATVPLVYLALLGSSSVTWRTGQGIWNDGMLVPGVGDLLNLSSPTYLPQVLNWSARSGLTVPATYFAWFVLPLVPFLRWQVLRERWRELTGVGVVIVAYFLLTVSPSQLWMFRWPLRLVEAFYLGVAILLAVVLSAGLHRDRLRQRAAVSGVLLVLGAYLSWSAAPQFGKWHALALLVTAALTALVVRAVRHGHTRAALGLHLGTALVLLLQTSVFSGNFNVNPYYFPHSVQELRANVDERYRGTTMQFASLPLAAAHQGGLSPDGAWRDVLFGSAYRPAGVNSVQAYTGMGFRDFSETFCMTFIGESCPAGYRNLWSPRDAAGTTLADMMRLDTVVVQRGMVDDPQPEPGWAVRERDDDVTVLTRTEPRQWPDGRLGAVSGGVEVVSDVSDGDTSETVRFTSSGGGAATFTFARLNWPGYTAHVGGRELPISTGPAGLLVVEVPEDVTSGDITLEWTPPGFLPGIVAALVGLVGAVALGALAWWRNRRSGQFRSVSPGRVA
ncbi:hypothetical protein [Umezawaea beigongshangensis]|uniref:hypothetical protein n=1 Tax=Umezawaea beigongshangensis TaxID=2780383 RepID=UPI0018F25001|nr:hypothetical protein [Umezawaea beigongshangensis]